MMRKVWTFVKKHHRKGIFAAAVIGSGILLTKYGISKIQARRQQHLTEYFDNIRREKNYEATQQCCNQTISNLIKSLESKITKLLNSDELRDILKTNPKNKIELWEELKIIAFTRATIAVYGTAILVLLLRTQFNIIGGVMYLSTANNGKTDEKSMMGSSELQERFLESVEYFVGTGINDLIEILKPIVENIVGSISLKEKLKLTNVDEIFKAIRNGFEKDEKLALKNLSRYSIPVNNKTAVSDYVKDDLNRLNCETSDILDSDEFSIVLNRAIDIGFSNLSDLGTDFYMKNCLIETNEFQNPHDIEIAMAKLIPALNNFLFVLCCSKPKHLIENLFQDETIKLFATNVYDAFSQVTKV